MACKPTYKGVRYNSLEELYNANGVNEQQKQKAQQIYSEYLSQNPNGSIEGFKSWVDNSNIKIDENRDNQSIVFQKTPQSDSSTQYQLPQGREIEEFVASEKTIRDLAARMSYRIGIPVRFETDRTKKYKGKLEYGTAVINLAYATLDTPIHEILGHPIIRTIKGDNILRVGDTVNYSTILEKDKTSKIKSIIGDKYNLEDGNSFEGYELNKVEGNLYQNLLKELEYGKGKEVFDRIKRDYVFKKEIPYMSIIKKDTVLYYNKNTKTGYIHDNNNPNERKTFNSEQEIRDYLELNDKYTLEEQQEEAIVELLGLMTAEKLDNVKDGKLISLLKRLLKEMKAFMRELLNQKEVEIDKLPDNMTLGDIADLLAYSNSKLILPGNEVVYTTPDNQQFKTYQEANKHISDLAKSVEDVDLSHEILDLNISNSFTIFDKYGSVVVTRDSFEEAEKYAKETNLPHGYRIQNNNENLLNQFIEKNKPYEQSKEIIEEWKRVNNIQYNPEEVYSRGQEFVSVVGAYSDFDVNLMMQNLLQHIEDNQKAGGEFTISAFTKPVDRKIGHLEGGGGKIKFKIYPQSEDILWAANTDVYSGSVWDASEKVSKDKKSELLGVSYTKYPSLQNVNMVQPNLANIIDNLEHHHNELGISLTGNNFRLEYDEDIPYQTKKIINSINSILDQKYGKLVKPEIENKSKNKEVTLKEVYENIKNDNYEYSYQDDKYFNILSNEFNLDTNQDYYELKSELLGRIEEILKVNPDVILESGAKQPTQTNETLKESIDSVENRTIRVTNNEYRLTNKDNKWQVIEPGVGNTPTYAEFDNIEDAKKLAKELNFNLPKEKEYTEQALINTKIAKLKEVAKNYPRSLITSEVRPIPGYEKGDEYYESFKDELFLQKVSDSSFQQFQQSLNKPNTNPILQGNQQEQVKKFTELQERLNNKEFLEGAKNAFESSEELQNVYYEALGFKTKSEIEVSNRVFNPDMAPDGYSKIIILNGEPIGEFALLDIGNEVHLSGSLGARTEINTKYRGKGYGYQAYVELAKQVKSEGKVLVSGTNMTEDAIRVWEKLVKEGYANKVKRLVKGFNNFEEEVYIIDNSKLPISEITPQQKQKAQQWYSQYLDTIFPDSKVKDIVYHGTDTKFESFDKTKIGSKENGNFAKGFNFIGTRHHAKQYSQYSNSNIVLEQIIDLKNPFILTPNKGDSYIDIDNLNSKDKQLLTNIGLNLDKFTTVYDAIVNFGITKFTEKLKELGYDGFVRINNFSSPTNAHEYIVFEPEQIHILSSKKDLEMFRNFINFTKSEYAKYGDIQQFRDYIISKNFAAVEEFLVVNNKIDRKC